MCIAAITLTESFFLSLVESIEKIQTSFGAGEGRGGEGVYYLQFFYLVRGGSKFVAFVSLIFSNQIVHACVKARKKDSAADT